MWHVSSRSGVVLVAQTAMRFLTLPYNNIHKSTCKILTEFVVRKMPKLTRISAEKLREHFYKTKLLN